MLSSIINFKNKYGKETIVFQFDNILHGQFKLNLMIFIFYNLAINIGIRSFLFINNGFINFR